MIALLYTFPFMHSWYWSHILFLFLFPFACIDLLSEYQERFCCFFHDSFLDTR